MSLNNMSLDYASNRSGRELGDLVPSRYALRVGGIEVLVISDGVMPLPSGTVATNADAAEMAAWVREMRLPPGEFWWPLNVLVIRSGGRTVLVDSGAGSVFANSTPRAGLLASRLDAAGIDPASITDIVTTHLHMDHVGGLVSDSLRSRLRPGVPIHLASAEAEFWKSPDFSRNTFNGFSDLLRSTEQQFVDIYRNQFRLFDEEHEVAPGVLVQRTGGHTPGHSIIRIASGGDRMTFLGDAVFQNHFERPDWHNAFDHDPEEAIRVRVRLLRELAASRELLVAAHVSFPFGHAAIAGDAFRFLPAYWAY